MKFEFILVVTVTCSDEEDVVVFAFGGLDLRVHFDLGEPVAVNFN